MHDSFVARDRCIFNVCIKPMTRVIGRGLANHLGVTWTRVLCVLVCFVLLLSFLDLLLPTRHSTPGTLVLVLVCRLPFRDHGLDAIKGSF